MARVLLAAHPTVGHTNALRAIGCQLKAEGHAVAMVLPVMKLPFGGLFSKRWPEVLRAAVELPKKIEDDGLEVLPLQNPSLKALWYGAKIPRAQGQEELDAALHLFTSGLEKQSRNIEAHAKNWRADVVLADYLMPAALLAAELVKIPYVAFYHSALPFPVENAPPFGTHLTVEQFDSVEWKKAAKRADDLNSFFGTQVNHAAQKLGLPRRETSLLSHPISKDLNLLATAPELEPGLGPLEGKVVMTGPCLPKAKTAEKDDPALHVFHEAALRIYVSLGTVFNDKPEVFQVILNGLRKKIGPQTKSIQVVVSAGGSFSKLKSMIGEQGRKDVHVFRRVPQVALLNQVDVVITHGGNNTVQETLAAGIPMIVIPFGGDQIANAQRVQRLAVGNCLPPEHLTSTTLGKALQDLLEGEAPKKAIKLAKALKKYEGTPKAAREVLQLLH